MKAPALKTPDVNVMVSVWKIFLFLYEALKPSSMLSKVELFLLRRAIGRGAIFITVRAPSTRLAD